MKKLTVEERKQLVDTARGDGTFDLVIQDVSLFNVFTDEVYPVEIGIKNGYVAYVESREEFFNTLPALSYIKGEGSVAVPGFIDSHMHIESSMLTPVNFSKIAVPKGTTTIVTDPHEIGNVLGIRGVQYMVETGEATPMYQYALAPSCVPAAPGLETSGADFNAQEIEELLKLDKVIGIAEVMDYYGVIHNSQRMVDILALAEEKGLFIQGHLFTQDPKELAAYLCAGPHSNHELSSGADALLSVRNGMSVDARDSSFAKNIKELIGGISHLTNFTELSICTDDREPELITTEGHIDDCIRSAVRSGLSAKEAIKAATINTARQYGFKKLGAIAPGYIANINLIGSLDDIKAKKVFFEGELVADAGKLLKEIKHTPHPVETENSVHIPLITEEMLKIKAPVENGKIKVRVLAPIDKKSSICNESIEELPVVDGYISLKDHPDLNYIAIIHRHGRNKNMMVGVIRNFHLEKGAIAGTVSHDSHNLAVAYTNIEDALTAINEIKALGGGVVYADAGQTSSLALPVAGLMSDREASEVIPQIQHMNSILSKVGLEAYNPVMRLATVALPVIPTMKITDMGLVDTINQKFMDLFV